MTNVESSEVLIFASYVRRKKRNFSFLKTGNEP